MITTKHGNVLTAGDIIIHGCNAQGAMGSGIAKQIRAKWPKAYEDYREKYEYSGGVLHLGTNVYSIQTDNTIIVNAITQEFYGNDPNVLYVDYDAVRRCFERINKMYTTMELTTGQKAVVNFPLIGCGLANGDWDIVSKIIDDALDDSIEKVLWIYE